MNRGAALFLFFLLSFSASVFGGLFGPGEWYSSLTKPSWNPPDWLFGPVWTVLYSAIAVSGWLVWRETGWKHRAMQWFFVQLALNALWSFLFFGLERPSWALIEIVFLFAAILMTLLNFSRISAVAAGLLAPYLAWVGFATCLNGVIWWLNR